MDSFRGFAAFGRCSAPTPAVIGRQHTVVNDNSEVWVANALGREVILVPIGGEVLKRIETSQHCYACMLGGIDGKTLFAVRAAASD